MNISGVRTVPLQEAFPNGRRNGEALQPILLVVDDETALADLTATVLRGEGYTVYATYDAQSALQVSELVSPHLVVSDISMPGINGIELADRLKQTAPETQVLLYSASADEPSFVETARHAGCHFPILGKASGLRELLWRVRQLLAAASMA